MYVPDVTPDLPSRTWRAILAILRRLPQATLSRAFGALADTPLPPPMRAAVLGAFARAVGIDATEAELPIEEYGSLNQFFVRRLRPGARMFPHDPALFVSPVDGVAGESGEVHGGRLLQAKGRWYSAADLLMSEEEARRFEGGVFITLYLSPRHYHRIHAPCDGSIELARHVPGALLPVNKPSVSHIENLFARNERLFCYIDGPLGRVALIAVGAYNVGRISAAFDREWNAPAGSSAWVTNRRDVGPSTHNYDPAVQVRQGDEVMAFHLGSTVVMLLEPQRVELSAAFDPGTEVRLGTPIARAL